MAEREGDLKNSVDGWGAVVEGRGQSWYWAAGKSGSWLSEWNGQCYRDRGTLKSYLRGKVQLMEGIKIRQIDSTYGQSSLMATLCWSCQHCDLKPPNSNRAVSQWLDFFKKDCQVWPDNRIKLAAVEFKSQSRTWKFWSSTRDFSSNANHELSSAQIKHKITRVHSGQKANVCSKRKSQRRLSVRN